MAPQLVAATSPRQPRDGSMSSASSAADLPRDMVSKFRNSGPKSRAGCITCKIRRVKCDETKPCCDKCVSTGRTCDGYQPPKELKVKKSKRSKNNPATDNMLPRDVEATSVTTYVPCLDLQASWPERRSFHYFRSRNLSSMPGNFEPYLWDNLVLQFCHVYPAVQQSLIALGAIYEEHERRGTALTTSTPADENVLKQYNVAVKGLVDYLSSTNQDPRVALISCLMFVWIEFLQRNLDAGFRHLNSGLKILQNLRGSQIPGKISHVNDENKEDIYGALNRSFTRLRVQAAMHGSTSAGLTTSSTRVLEAVGLIPRSFLNIYEARICLDNEYNAIFGYMRTLRDGDRYSRYESMNEATIDSVRVAHLQRLEQWKQATEAMMASSLQPHDQTLKSGFMYLELYYTFITIALKTLLGGEMCFDKHVVEFERIATLCESLIHDHRHCKPPPLSFDMGVIPPLFFLILKCRLQPLRQKAMALLRLAPEQEGMFPRDSALKFCEWKVATEETGRGDLPFDKLLPESARIYQEHIAMKETWVGDSVMCIQYRKGPPRHDDMESVELPVDMEMVQGMGNML
ncbi:Beauvericin cluster-specific repressor BEA4 [Lachnellula cervina]|uniref:Beauvericin cluster-specific repressor BEA4 n=1 Tax=Lachnellula cervina TaxID=1316786 RepID=A0A7D8UK50_9HELO|nr:Beauvericin cluster-specific repressor BEA4 [Lachnellula cervina]